MKKIAIFIKCEQGSEIMQKNILVVDDSALMRKMISDIIDTDERFVIADTASNGLEAFDKVTQSAEKYDVIILDINMPKMTGIQLLEQFNKFGISIPVIIVSTYAREGTAETIKCLALGAFDFITKPGSLYETKGAEFRERLLTTMALACEGNKASGHVVPQPVKAVAPASVQPVRKTENERKATGSNVLVALACSTGGPKALQEVIPYLPKNLAAPMVIVQHMPKGFTASLAGRLDELSKISVKEAEEGDILEAGKVYIAKGGRQLKIQKSGKDYKIIEADEPARGGLKPCADIMYESLADSDFDEIVCVVLTGMGADGSSGISGLSKKRKVYVIAQDEASSIVYGMPKMIKMTGLTDEVLDLGQIADAITRKVGVR